MYRRFFLITSILYMFILSHLKKKSYSANVILSSAIPIIELDMLIFRHVSNATTAISTLKYLQLFYFHQKRIDFYL